MNKTNGYPATGGGVPPPPMIRQDHPYSATDGLGSPSSSGSFRNSTATYHTAQFLHNYLVPHVVAIAMLSFAILLLLTCGVCFCKILMWSRRRRAPPRESAAYLNSDSRQVVEVALNEVMATETYAQILSTAAAEARATSPVASDTERRGSLAISVTEEDLCSVCLCEFESSETVRQLPCSHYFHAACIDPWLQKTGTCPSCRWSLMEWLKEQEEGTISPTLAASMRRSSTSVGSRRSSSLAIDRGHTSMTFQSLFRFASSRTGFLSGRASSEEQAATPLAQGAVLSVPIATSTHHVATPVHVQPARLLELSPAPALSPHQQQQQQQEPHV
mmetsp:Transcript_19151/g.34139  ORF Transcript_19151/g.34139 Transcript_19151/m.34139 type:complete len:331 (-) Transcript_19151:101-1093(-)